MLLDGAVHENNESVHKRKSVRISNTGVYLNSIFIKYDNVAIKGGFIQILSIIIKILKKTRT
jgi:hypothetical protein